MSRIAFLTPLPPQATGIADYAATVLAGLAGRVDVDVYCEQRSPDRIPGVRIRRATVRGLRRLDSYDAVVAQIGNSAAHDWILEWIRHRPATVVLHELVVHHLVAHFTLRRGRHQEYVDTLAAAGGTGVVPQALAAMAGRAEPVWEVEADRYPLAEFVTRHATNVLVHSHHMAAALRSGGFDREVAVVPFPAPLVDDRGIAARTEHAGSVTVGVFGFITPNKRLPVVLEAVKLAASRVSGLRLLVVGGSPSGIAPAGLARHIGLPAGVLRVEAYSDRPRYESLLSRVDIGVNLRHPTFGETSAAVVDFMTRGVPVVVSTGGWYDELPEAAVARVAPDANEVVGLAATLEYLARDAERRRAMGDAARIYARTVLDPARTADAYIRAVLGRIGREPLEASLRRSLARSVGEVSAVLGASTAPLASRVGEAAGRIGLLSPERP